MRQGKALLVCNMSGRSMKHLFSASGIERLKQQEVGTYFIYKSELYLLDSIQTFKDKETYILSEKSYNIF